MGQMTDAKIAAWQEAAGIAPAQGEYAKRLQELSQAAYELIQIVELERSGIRDGAGFWCGCDPLHGKVLEISDRWQLYRRAQQKEADTAAFLDDFIPA